MSWVRLDDAAVDHPAVLAAGDLALGALIRLAAYSAKHNLGGYVPAAGARQIAPSKSIKRLLDAGLLQVDGDGYAIVQAPAGVVHIRSPEEVAKDRAEASARQRAHRERQRAHRPGGDGEGGGNSGDQGGCHGVTDGVTHLVSHGSPSRPVPSHPDPREKEPERENAPDGASPSPGSSLSGKGKIAEDAKLVLDKLNAARARAFTDAKPLKPTRTNLRGITDRLRDGHTVEDCEAVISVYEAEKHPEYFNAVSPFRPDSFSRALAKLSDDIRPRPIPPEALAMLTNSKDPMTRAMFTDEERAETHRRITELTRRNLAERMGDTRPHPPPAEEMLARHRPQEPAPPPPEFHALRKSLGGSDEPDLSWMAPDTERIP